MLNAHPFKNNPDAPLWVNLSKYQYGSQLSYKGTRKIIQERTRIANLSKRVYFHLFRHSQITQTANFLTEAQQKKRYGWSASSKMPARYTHLVDEDVEDAFLGYYEIKKQKGPTVMTPIKCPSCDTFNACDVDFCEKCQKPLSLEKAYELEQKEQENIAKLEERIARLEEIEKEYREMLDGFKRMDELQEQYVLR